jgi:hypothetical protein
MWMSEARSWMAWRMSRLASLTIGASSVAAVTWLSSSVSSASSTASEVTSSTSPSRRWCLSMAAAMAARVATTVRTRHFAIERMSSMASTLAGSAMATTRVPSSQAMGSAW